MTTKSSKTISNSISSFCYSTNIHDSSGISNHEEYDNRVPEDSVPDEEVQLNEELQIILPPRYDDVTADSSITTTTTDQSIS